MSLDKQLLEQHLAQIECGGISPTRAAESPGISLRHLTRLMKQRGIHRAAGLLIAISPDALQRKQHLMEYGKKVLHGEMTIVAAAKAAFCSVTTMNRVLQRLRGTLAPYQGKHRITADANDRPPQAPDRPPERDLTPEERTRATAIFAALAAKGRERARKMALKRSRGAASPVPIDSTQPPRAVPSFPPFLDCIEHDG